MRAVYASSFSPQDPLSGLVVGERPDPVVEPGWSRVTVRAAALNHHDLWTLRGVGLAPEALPMILGGDAAGVDDSDRPVIVHSVINDPAWQGEEVRDPKRSLLSERFQGTLADYVVVPEQNLIPMPAFLTFEQAACLPTAWLTAYRMLFTQSELQPGDTVLIQGASGGVATAAISLASAAGYQVWVTSRSEEKRAGAKEIGAHETFESGAKLPGRVDAVIETVGKATWAHSVRSLRPGGTIVLSGTTSGDAEPAMLTHIFFRELRIIGSTMGTREDFRSMLDFLERTGVRPIIHRTMPIEQAHEGFAEMLSDSQFGKIVFTF
jgi:NADPH:quinone reductase-like Zn-dependent oxidoreductase